MAECRVLLRLYLAPVFDFFRQSLFPGISVRTILSARYKFDESRILFAKALGIGFTNRRRRGRLSIVEFHRKHPAGFRLIRPLVQTSPNGKHLKQAFVIVGAENTASSRKVRGKIRSSILVWSDRGLPPYNASASPRTIYDEIVR